MVEQPAGTVSSLQEQQLITGVPMNRREFALSGVAAAFSGAAAGLVPRSTAGQMTLAPPAASRPSVRLYTFIYDCRYSASRAFGVAAERARSTAGTVAIGGDITALWSRDLRPQWSAGGGAIAGMTTARTFFCLEQLAKDHWMRVVTRAEHAIVEGNEIAHRLTAPGPSSARLRSALAAEDWPAKMPAALATCPGTDGSPRLTCVVGPACGHRLRVTDEKLVSFVIA
jgi:hypothetical protein